MRRANNICTQVRFHLRVATAKLLVRSSADVESTLLFAVRLSFQVHQFVRKSAPRLSRKRSAFSVAAEGIVVPGVRPSRGLLPPSVISDSVVCVAVWAIMGRSFRRKTAPARGRAVNVFPASRDSGRAKRR